MTLQEGVDADPRQRDGQQDHDQRVVQGHLDELANHIALLRCCCGHLEPLPPAPPSPKRRGGVPAGRRCLLHALTHLGLRLRRHSPRALRPVSPRPRARFQSSRAALSSPTPVFRMRSPGRSGSSGCRFLFLFRGRQPLGLGEGRAADERHLLEAVRQLDAPHRVVVLVRVGLHEHDAVLAVFHHGVERHLDDVLGRRDADGGRDELAGADLRPGVVDVSLDHRRVLVGVDQVADLLDRALQFGWRPWARRSCTVHFRWSQARGRSGSAVRPRGRWR